MKEIIERLSGLPQPFTAAFVARKGWAGLRTRAAASDALDELVKLGRLRKLPANRKGQATYATSLESLEAPEQRVYWSSWGDGEASIGQMTDDSDIPMFGVMHVPEDDSAAEIARLAKALEGGRLPRLRIVADRVRETVRGSITFDALAWILAVAQDRIDPEFAPLPGGRETGWSIPQTNDPVSTHLRGIARFVGIRYETMLRAVRVAEAELKECRDWEPTMFIADREKRHAA